MIIPSTYSKHRHELSWEQIRWAYQKGIIDWRYLVAKAIDRLSSGSSDEDEIELASIISAEANSAGEILDRVSNETSDETAQKTWLCIMLSALYEERETFSDPFAIVEEIYADFAYPKEMTPFIRYMPPQDGYDPTRHSLEDNMARLSEKWRRYVDAC